MLRAIHVVAGLDAADGGPSYSIPRLCRALATADIHISLLSIAGSSEVAGIRYTNHGFPQDFARAPILRSLRYSSALVRALRRAAALSDLIHSHGLWLMPNVEAGWVAAGAGKPLVVSPRGMLAPAALQFSRLKKRAFWHLLQGAVIRRAACLHATSEAEYEEIRAFGLANPVAVIPNGIDLPEASDTQPALRSSGARTVLSLGRLHPKKGLDLLIHAWAKVESSHLGWRLRIVGPDEDGHADTLRALARCLRLMRVSVEGPIYGEAKWEAYRGAELFVLPSLNENFGLTVAESLAAGMPAIVTKGAPWRALASEACGWWIDHGIEPLAAALATAMSMPSEALGAMGRRGQRWMEREFSWDRVASDMTSVYSWLAGKSEPPTVVRLC